MPSYYKGFKCIASKCKHNCCIGWEIDIDNDTLVFYKQQSDIIKNINLNADTPHFILGKDDRCPFLNDKNLCGIILNHGKEALCQICRDHPRFVNFFNSRTEIGLGLTCEAAVKLILDNDFYIKKYGENEDIADIDQDETDFFAYREDLFKNDVGELKNILPDVSLNTLYDIFKNLERLDNSWDTILNTIKGKKEKLADLKFKDSKCANRLFSYFLFRHLHNYGLEFCIFCTYFILSIDYDIYETARMFSSEIEYSDENIEKLLALF